MALHQVIGDEVRSEPRDGRWAETKRDLVSGKTVFVAEPDDDAARNALHQRFRTDETLALRRSKRSVVDGQGSVRGTAFWLESR